MAITYLKKANPPIEVTDTKTAQTVAQMLTEIKAGGEEAVRRYARDLDGYQGDIVLGESHFAAAERALTEGIKGDIRFSMRRIQDFAKRQRDSMQDNDKPSVIGINVQAPEPVDVEVKDDQG